MSDDETEAKRVAYNPMQNLRYLCVTLKGDKYNPQGTLEGGFNKQAGLLNNVTKFKEN